MKIKILKIAAIVSLLVYALLAFKFYQGSIINLQIYIAINIISFVFWTFIIMLSILLLIGDTGFIKIGAFLTIVLGILFLVFQVIDYSSDFEMLKSDDHDLVLETITETNRDVIKVYKKDNFLFSKYIDSFTVAGYYEYSLEIVGDNLVITKCTEISCINTELELD